MGRYNEFTASITCPLCGQVTEVEFQADIGVLEYQRFRPGDTVFGLPRQMRRSPVGPDLGLENADFWAYGVGLCLYCKKELWARIGIRSNRFDSLVLVEQPDNPDAWGRL